MTRCPADFEGLMATGGWGYWEPYLVLGPLSPRHGTWEYLATLTHLGLGVNPPIRPPYSTPDWRLRTNHLATRYVEGVRSESARFYNLPFCVIRTSTRCADARYRQATTEIAGSIAATARWEGRPAVNCRSKSEKLCSSTRFDIANVRGSTSKECLVG